MTQFFGIGDPERIKEMFGSREEAVKAVKEMAREFYGPGTEIVAASFVGHRSGLRCLGVEIRATRDGLDLDAVERLIGVDDPEYTAWSPATVRGIKATAWLEWDYLRGKDILETTTMFLDDKMIPIRVEKDYDIAPEDLDRPGYTETTRRRLADNTAVICTRCVYSELRYTSRGMRFSGENILDIIAELEECYIQGVPAVTVTL